MRQDSTLVARARGSVRDRVVQAQARSIAYDLLQASGLDSEAAIRAVHRAWDSS